MSNTFAMRHEASRVMLIGMFALSTFALTACSALSGNGQPAQKEQAKLDISIEADRDMNTDNKGRGAPMLLRVYELKSDIAFQDADFFALQKTDKAVLGADLLAVDQFILRPGETRKIKRKSNPETTAIAIFAGYRDLPTSIWRVVYKMEAAPESSWYRAIIPANKAKLKIALQSNAILMTDEEAGTRPVQYANESIKGLDQNPLEGAKQQLDTTLQSVPKMPEKPSFDSLKGLATLPKK